MVEMIQHWLSVKYRRWRPIENIKDEAIKSVTVPAMAHFNVAWTLQKTVACGSFLQSSAILSQNISP